jgi:hypothetical protein
MDLVAARGQAAAPGGVQVVMAMGRNRHVAGPDGGPRTTAALLRPVLIAVAVLVGLGILLALLVL